jgi:predicted house-cleaning NTP pyrophosphatase (Maf/HAM1 superfamily)
VSRQLKKNWSHFAQCGAGSVRRCSLLTDLVFDYQNVITEIDQQMQRLGWDIQTGQDYILKTYGKKSRQLLKR